MTPGGNRAKRVDLCRMSINQWIMEFFVSCKSLASTPRNRTTRAFATAMFGLRLALRLFEKMNNDVTTTTSTVSNPLLHVRPPHAGGIACCSKQKYVLVYEPPRAWARERVCSSKINILFVIQVDATHHSTVPTCLPLNLAKRPVVYNIFAATSNIYPPQIKIYIPVLTR